MLQKAIKTSIKVLFVGLLSLQVHTLVINFSFLPVASNKHQTYINFKKQDINMTSNISTTKKMGLEAIQHWEQEIQTRHKMASRHHFLTLAQIFSLALIISLLLIYKRR